MKENTDSRGKLITSLERALDPTRELHFETQTKGFQLHAGIKMVVDENFLICAEKSHKMVWTYIFPKMMAVCFVVTSRQIICVILLEMSKMILVLVLAKDIRYTLIQSLKEIESQREAVLS